MPVPEIGRIISILKDNFRRAAAAEGELRPHEVRASELAKSLRSELTQVLTQPLDYYPVQWGVRTSMQEMGNLSALAATLADLPEQIKSELTTELGMGVSDAEELLRVKADEVGRVAADRAYVGVECNIDQQNLTEPAKFAEMFFQVLEKNLARHRPDRQEVITDTLGQLRDQTLAANARAYFEAKYHFLAQK